MYFDYGEKETAYLKSKDRALAAAIDRIGHIYRQADEDLFSSVIRHIIAQQVSSAAQASVWKRLSEKTGAVNAETILALDRVELQSVGITYKKADHILAFAGKVKDGSFDMFALENMADEDIIRELSSLKGIGVWTAEMILTFCMRRPDIVSFGDLAILRGMRMLYRHRKIDRITFERYRKRYSPYGTVASLYLWAIAGGALPELSDPAAMRKKP